MRENDLAGGSLHLLLVCTGNICRSPAAQGLAADVLDPRFTVTSAGTHARDGTPISPQMLALLVEARAPFSGFAARRLTAPMVRAADLILTMTRDHRAAAVEIWPAAVRRTFTLLEFARLVQCVNVNDLPQGGAVSRYHAAVPLAAAERRQVVAALDQDDIADPYRQPDADYAFCFGQIRNALHDIESILKSR